MILIFMNTGFILLTAFAFIIYTSLFQFMPWYSPEELQFLTIPFFYAPLMLVLWVWQLYISKDVSISRVTKWLPLATTTILTALPFIDEHLGLFVQVTGILTCVLSIILTCFCAGKDLLLTNKTQSAD